VGIWCYGKRRQGAFNTIWGSTQLVASLAGLIAGGIIKVITGSAGLVGGILGGAVGMAGGVVVEFGIICPVGFWEKCINCIRWIRHKKALNSASAKNLGGWLTEKYETVKEKGSAVKEGLKDRGKCITTSI